MTVDQLIDVATRLEELACELETSASDPTGSAAPVQLDGTLGRVSRMDEMQSQQMALAAQRRNQQRLASVKAAIQRIEQGSFGRCVQCEREIAFNRLEALPDAALCLSCADKAPR